MVTNHGPLDIMLLFGVIGGVRVFFKGFRPYREARFIKDTPGTPIRSIAMGFVRIHGKAKSDKLVSSPVSHTPCCFYTVEVKKYEKGGDDRSGSWSHYGAEANGDWFYLEDATGRVMVNPHEAEYELEMTGVREVESWRASSFAGGGVSETELLAYVARVGSSPEIPGLHLPVARQETRDALAKYKKHEITREELLQGMMAPHLGQIQQGLAQIQQQLEARGPSSDPREEEVRLATIELYKIPIWDPKYEQMRRRIVKMQQQYRKETGKPEPPDPNFLHSQQEMDEYQKRMREYRDRTGSSSAVPSKASAPTLDSAPPAASPPLADPPLAAAPPCSSDRPLASGKYMLTECCILPDHDYDISGTCAENPGAKDSSDRHLIRKGTSEPTYLISARAQKDVNRVMQARAQLMIFGGGMLSVFCLALLLFRFGLL